MLVNDRQYIDTLGCRLSSKLCRGEAGVSVRKETDNPTCKDCLSRREEDEFSNYSEIRNTHYPFKGGFTDYGLCFR